MKCDIFISYSRKDAQKVNEYVSFFESLGYTVWMDRSGIESGDAFRQVIVQAIEDAKLFVFFSSKHSNKSKWTSSEIAIAIEENKKIIPIKLDTAKYTPAVRMDLVGIDYVDDKAPGAMHKVEQSLIAVLGKRNHKPLEPKIDNAHKNKRRYIIFLSAFCILVSFLLIIFLLLRDEDKNRETYIDNGMQGICERVLKKGMSNMNNETQIVNADLLLMECETGKIRAKVSLSIDSTQGVLASNRGSFTHESSLSKIANILACIETGKVNKSTIFDTGFGVLDIHGHLMRDHNWRRGGYGKISLSQVVEYNSNIGVWLAADSCFQNSKEMAKVLQNMGYGLPDDSIKGFFLYPQKKNFERLERNNTKSFFPWYSIGYNQQITDVQLLAFFNAIPNRGKMIKPRLYKERYTVVNPCIARRESLQEIRDIMQNYVISGLGKKAQSEIIGISGFNSTTQFIDDTHYLRQFFAYFPSDSPRYSVLLSLEYKGWYNNTIAEIINEIAELMYFKEIS